MLRARLETLTRANQRRAEKIPERGMQFRNICRKVVANNSSKFCKDR